MVPVVVKAVHVCQVHNLTENTATSTQGHNADSCSICHFAFLTFDKAEFVVLAVAIATAVFAAHFFFKARYRFEAIVTLGQRGPPHTL